MIAGMAGRKSQPEATGEYLDPTRLGHPSWKQLKAMRSVGLESSPLSAFGQMIRHLALSRGAAFPASCIGRNADCGPVVSSDEGDSVVYAKKQPCNHSQNPNRARKARKMPLVSSAAIGRVSSQE